MPDQPPEGDKPAESFRKRAERIILFEVTSNPHALALTEGLDLVGTTLTPNETTMLALTYTKAVRVALLDLADQLDALHGRQVKPE